MIAILVGEFGTFTKGWVKTLENLEIREQEESICTTALLQIGQNTENIAQLAGDEEKTNVIFAEG